MVKLLMMVKFLMIVYLAGGNCALVCKINFFNVIVKP